MKNNKNNSVWKSILGTDEYQWIRVPYNTWPTLKKAGLTGWDIPIFISFLIKKSPYSDKVYVSYDYLSTSTGCNRKAIFASLAKFKDLGLQKLGANLYDVKSFFDIIKNAISDKKETEDKKRSSTEVT